jgi:hypothetical protein
MPTLLLSGLIVLRLLMPPGICVCKLTSPALRLLAVLQGAEPPVAPLEVEDDDHSPGCPASYLSQGLGVAPPSGPGPITLSLTGFSACVCPTPLPSATDLLPHGRAPAVLGPPLYVELCAFLI